MMATYPAGGTGGYQTANQADYLEQGMGGYNAGGYNEYGIGKDERFGMKAEAQMRLAFIRKVFGVLSIQLLLTAAVCAYTTLNEAANTYVLTHPQLAVVGIVLSIVLLIALFCFRQRHPTNIVLLGLWTLVEAYTIGVVTAAYARAGEGVIVLEAVGLTAAVFVALTIYTMQSKIDFSFLGGALFACLWVLVIWSFVSMIFGFVPGFFYSLFGAIVFSLYIIFDVYMALNKLNYDEWVLASVNLYLDIVNLFIFILQLLSSRRD